MSHSVRISLLSFLAVAVLFGQASGPGAWVAASTAPSGPCTASYGVLVNPAGNLYTCQNGTWAQVSSGGGAPSGPAGGVLSGTYPNPGISPTFFPKVVASVNYVGQTGDLSFNLLPTPATGDYVLNDVLQIEVADSGGNLSYIVSWMGDGGNLLNGYFSDTGITSPVPIIAVSQGTTLSQGTPSFDGQFVQTPPTVIHAVSGTPISVAITCSSSSVGTVSPTAGNAGLGYAIGDTGVIDTGDGTATYTVTAVVTGAVVSATASGGNNYSVSTGNSTETGGGQPGIGTGLELDILTLGPISYSYHATLARNQ